MTKPRVVSEGAGTLSEGPVWDGQEGRLYWIDIIEGRIYRLDPAAQRQESMSVGQYVGAVALRRDEGLVGALQHGFYLIDFNEGQLKPVADPEADDPGTRFNDGACDPQGRFWAGTMSLEDTPNAGSLYRLNPDTGVTRVLEGVSISNGIAWSADSRRMYYIDTPTRRIDVFDVDPDSGDIRNRRPVVSVPEGMGFPDGMTIDAEGKLWVALWDGWRVCRWDPDSGELLQEIELPAQRVTACAFGGPDLQTLFVTTARLGLSEAERAAQPEAGYVFAVDVGVRGTLKHRFGG